MKIALCSSYVPFINGGLRNIVEWLEQMLLEAGHQVEVVYLPHVDVPDLIFSQMAAYRWVDLTGSADRVICFRPPAHVIEHGHKILWFIHHIRAFYDLWDTPYRGFADDAHHRGIRNALHAVDDRALREARKVFTNSRVVSGRLKQFNDLDSEVLYPPVFRPERFINAGTNDEIVCVCRVEHHKRQHLLLEAMRHTLTPVKLRLCGTGSGPQYTDKLLADVAASGLAERVTCDFRWITEEEKAQVLSTCLAAAYLPLDEDSYGYPSLEASHASKPVLTTTDSGGVLELVQDGRNGLVCEPDPQAIAEAMDRLYTDRDQTIGMGQQAKLRLDELQINWPHVIERLLA